MVPRVNPNSLKKVIFYFITKNTPNSTTPPLQWPCYTPTHLLGLFIGTKKTGVGPMVWKFPHDKTKKGYVTL
jgi:hypothetical protein